MLEFVLGGAVREIADVDVHDSTLARENSKIVNPTSIASGDGIVLDQAGPMANIVIKVNSPAAGDKRSKRSIPERGESCQRKADSHMTIERENVGIKCESVLRFGAGIFIYERESWACRLS